MPGPHDARGCRCTRRWRSICSRTLGEFTEVEAKARQAMQELRDIDGMPKVAAARGAPRPRCATTRRRGCPGSGSCTGTACPASSRTTWAWERRSRRLSLLQKVKQRGGPASRRWWSRPPACSPTGSARPSASPRASRPSCGTARTARSAPRSSRTWTSCSPPTRWCAATWRSSRKVGFRYVILDEAQNIKNADSRHRAGLQVAAERHAAGAHRHAAGEPPHRAVEPLRLPDAGLPRQRGRASATATSSPSRWPGDMERARPAAPPHPARSSCAA